MPPHTFPILQAAALQGTTLHFLPSQPPPPPQSSPDPLAALMLQLLIPLINEIPNIHREKTPLILATTHGCRAADTAFDRSRREQNARFASPAAFSRTLPSTLPAELSVKLNLKGPLLVVTSPQNSTALALRRAISWMHNFNAPYALAGGFDEPTPTHPAQAALLLLQNNTLPPSPHALTLTITTPSDSQLDPHTHDASLANLITCIAAPLESTTIASGITIGVPSPTR